MRKIWFKRKLYGWGWTPVTWQGWAILALYLVFLFAEFRKADQFSHSGSDTLIAFSGSFIVVTIFLILICYATGEEPRWQWGRGSEDKIEPSPASPLINFTDFTKVDLRVGRVISAERVTGSEKLLKLMVDEGLTENRQIIAGLGKSYQPADLLGKKIVFVANLEPRKLMGLESRGMILAVTDKDGPVVIEPSRDVPEGGRLS